MSQGNCILLTPFKAHRHFEGIVGAGLTIYPGTAVQLQPATALVGGRHTVELYNADADGGRPKGPIIIAVEDHLQGRPMTTAYTAGERFFGYVPEAGDELNLLLGDVSGTGDAHTKGEILIIDDGTGEFIATTGSPEEEVAQLLETLAAPTADTLAWCVWQR